MRWTHEPFSFERTFTKLSVCRFGYFYEALLFLWLIWPLASWLQRHRSSGKVDENEKGEIWRGRAAASKWSHKEPLGELLISWQLLAEHWDQLEHHDQDIKENCCSFKRTHTTQSWYRGDIQYLHIPDFRMKTKIEDGLYFILIFLSTIFF